MADQVLLYISAASDLENEREVLAKAVIDIPVTLGWRIVQSPIKGGKVDQEAISKADLHILLLGGDIRAPIGLEWHTARLAGRTPRLFIKEDIPRTPAALIFFRYIQEQGSWHAYKDSADLRHQVLVMLAQHLIDHAAYYALTPEELVGLMKWEKEIKSSASLPVDETLGGAGDSSLILSQERYVPSDGVLIKPPEKSKQGE